jgi:hypothetical protein
MSEKELNLLKIAAALPAELGAGPTQTSACIWEAFERMNPTSLGSI